MSGPLAEGGTVRAAVAALLRGTGRRPVRLVVITAVLAVVVAWYLGMDIWHALTVGAGLGALGLCWITLPGRRRKTEWPLETGRVAEGARREVSQLSWSLPHHGRAQHTGLRRVQDLARRRLALHGLELDAPADGPGIRKLIGSSAYSTLRPTARKLPTVRAVVHCLDMLDRLDPLRSATALSAVPARRSGTSDSPLLALIGKRTRHDR